MSTIYYVLKIAFYITVSNLNSDQNLPVEFGKELCSKRSYCELCGVIDTSHASFRGEMEIAYWIFSNSTSDDSLCQNPEVKVLSQIIEERLFTVDGGEAEEFSSFLYRFLYRRPSVFFSALKSSESREVAADYIAYALYWSEDSFAELIEIERETKTKLNNDRTLGMDAFFRNVKHGLEELK